MNIAVNEIFDSIQGEGWFQGVPATFLRLQGCNLRCPWCDTPNALDRDGEHDRDVEDVATELLAHSPNLVVVTGGEPLLQMEPLLRLVDMLKLDRAFHLETNGTLGLPKDHWFRYIVVSPKPPRYEVSCCPDEIKIVVTGQFEIEMAKVLAEHYAPARISLQPVNNDPEAMKLIWDYLLTMNNRKFRAPMWKLSVQLHKMIGVK